MQRVLKYPLLLKDILKRTADKHPEYTTLPLALKTIQDAAKYINEAKRDLDNVKIITEIQSSLKDFVPGSPGVVPLVRVLMFGCD